MNGTERFFEHYLPQVIMAVITAVLGVVAGSMIQQVCALPGHEEDVATYIWAGVLIFLFGLSLGLLIGWNIKNRQLGRKQDRGEQEDAGSKELTERLKEQFQQIEELEAENESLGSQCAYLVDQVDNLTEALANKPAEVPNLHGLSKRALNAWNLMEERDKTSLGRLAGASILSGETPILPLVLDMDGSLVNIGLDTSMVKSLERLGLLEKYPERALMPIKEADEKCPIMQGVDAFRGEAIFATVDGIYMTRGCAAQFCVPGDYASPPIQCVDLGLYGYTDIAQEILRYVDTIKSPMLFSYLDAAYQKRREAGQPFYRWETEI